MKKREQKWDEEISEFNGNVSRWWRKCKKEMKNIFDWYLFYNPKDKADKTWHFIEIFITDILLLKIFGLI
jgi:hypothetical protein